MFQLIYASRSTGTPTPGDLIEILDVSRLRNVEDAVTGLLLYAAGSYLQILEGTEGDVEATFARICADPRHTAIRLLTRRPSPGRQFPDWSMGFEHPDEDVLTTTLPGYNPSAVHPLVNADTVRTAQDADRLLLRYAVPG